MKRTITIALVVEEPTEGQADAVVQTVIDGEWFQNAFAEYTEAERLDVELVSMSVAVAPDVADVETLINAAVACYPRELVREHTNSRSVALYARCQTVTMRGGTPGALHEGMLLGCSWKIRLVSPTG